MKRIGALFAKELREHGLLLGALTLLLAVVGLLLLVGALAAARTVTLLEAHATFVRFFLPIVALALGHRLVVREYQRGTQRFLEALPLRRWEVLITKLVLGLLFLSFVAAVSLAVCVAAASFREPVTLRWVALVALRTELFALALGAFFLTMGLLGRFRIPIYLALAFAAAFLSFATDVELVRFGPFALVAERLVLERDALPWREVGETLLVTGGMLALGAALALSREGAIAEGLARRMTAREKGAVGLVFIAALIASEVFDAKRDKEPFAFEHEAVARHDEPRVEVLYLEPRHRSAAQALAAIVASDLEGARGALGIEELPPVHVALRESTDPRVVERVRLQKNDGVLLRASFTSQGFDRDALRTAVLEQVLEHVTDRRAAFEPYVWIRTGLARSLVHEGEALPDPALRALWVARSERPRFSLLERWQRTEERLGPAAADGLAYLAATAIRERAGRARWHAFARSLVAREPPPALLAVFDLRLDPIAARLERTTELSVPALDEALRARIAALRAHPGAEVLVRAPRLAGTIEVERAEGGVRSLSWRLTADRPFEPGTRCALLHAAAGPHDRPFREDELFREEVGCEELLQGSSLVGRYGPGERVLAAIEVDMPVLGAPVRVATTRLEVR